MFLHYLSHNHQNLLVTGEPLIHQPTLNMGTNILSSVIGGEWGGGQLVRNVCVIRVFSNINNDNFTLKLLSRMVMVDKLTMIYLIGNNKTIFKTIKSRRVFL